MIFTAGFSAVQIRRRLILKNPAILAPKTALFKKSAKKRAEVQTPAPLFLSGYPVHEAGETLYAKVALSGGRHGGQ